MNNTNFTNKIVGLVGNASSLLHKDHSQHIDSNDLVCRINRGIPTDKVQGKKFNYLFCSGKNLINDIKKEIPSEVKIIFNNEIINEINLDLRSKLDLKTKKQQPSTGLLALSYIIEQNPKVINLYGFDWLKTKTYYEEQYYKKNDIVWNAHNFKQEEKLIRDYYCKNYDIRIFE
jgi:hypothetical protein